MIGNNEAALKEITRDSIGKIKDVATNCVQIEANIRALSDKEARRDLEIKQLRHQVCSAISSKEEIKLRETEQEKTKSMELQVNDLNKKIANLSQDQRTKDGETEERQMSLEQNLQDV